MAVALVVVSLSFFLGSSYSCQSKVTEAFTFLDVVTGPLRTYFERVISKSHVHDTILCSVLCNRNFQVI